MEQNNSEDNRKVVYVINSLNIGGAQIGLCRLVNGLDCEQYEFTIIALNGIQQEVNDRLPSWVNIINLDGSLKTTMQYLQKMFSEIRSAEVIIGSLYHAVLFARCSKIINWGSHVMTWQHSERFKKLGRGHLFRSTAFLSDIHLADSEPVEKVLTTVHGLDQKVVHTIPIAGIDITTYDTVDHEGTEGLTVGSVGQLSKAKNYHKLLDVAENYSGEDLKFRIAGDGPLRENLISDSQKRGLKNVSFMGDIRDVPQFLSEIDIYFQPSVREGLCISVLEAMAAGLPIVGSNVGGIDRNVVDEQNGFLCEPDDTEGFIGAIEELRQNPNLRADFGRNGQDLVSEEYTQEVLVREFEEAINK